MRPCEAIGPDRTQLIGCVKLYLPLDDAPPSERAMAFVLRLARGQDGTLAWISSPSAIAIQDRAYAACMSEHIASCMVAFPAATLCVGRDGAKGGARKTGAFSLTEAMPLSDRRRLNAQSESRSVG